MGKLVGMGQFFHSYTHPISFFLSCNIIFLYMKSFSLSCLLFPIALNPYVVLNISLYLHVHIIICLFVILCLSPQMGIGPFPRLYMGSTLRWKKSHSIQAFKDLFFLLYIYVIHFIFKQSPSPFYFYVIPLISYFIPLPFIYCTYIYIYARTHMCVYIHKKIFYPLSLKWFLNLK